MAAINDYPQADYHFYKVALQYYAAGRFAALTAMMPVSGNIIHHAVEMVLKGRLTYTLTLAEMAAKLYRHNLPRIWQEFKALFQSEDLSRFDRFIDLLHEFDSIRYPDRILKKGAQITVGFVTENLLGTSTQPEPPYRLSITDLDALMNELFRRCPINPEGYLHAYNDAAEVIRRHNVSCQGWFPSHTHPALAGV